MNLFSDLVFSLEQTRALNDDLSSKFDDRIRSTDKQRHISVK